MKYAFGIVALASMLPAIAYAENHDAAASSTKAESEPLYLESLDLGSSVFRDLRFTLASDVALSTHSGLEFRLHTTVWNPEGSSEVSQGSGFGASWLWYPLNDRPSLRGLSFGFGFDDIFNASVSGDSFEDIYEFNATATYTLAWKYLSLGIGAGVKKKESISMVEDLQLSESVEPTILVRIGTGTGKIN
jgi:hypothetical protein